MRNENNKELIKKALTIYKSLGDLLDSYLHMIIPFLCKLITRENDIIDFEIRKDIIDLFKCLCKEDIKIFFIFIIKKIIIGAPLGYTSIIVSQIEVWIYG